MVVKSVVVGGKVSALVRQYSVEGISSGGKFGRFFMMFIVSVVGMLVNKETMSKLTKISPGLSFRFIDKVKGVFYELYL